MNPLLQVSEQEIERLDEHQLADIVNRLLKAEAQRYGIPPLSIQTTLRISDPDGGVDARVEHSVSIPPECRIPQGLSVWQYKAGDIDPHEIQIESQKPGVQTAIQAGGSYRFVVGRGYTGELRKSREEAVGTCYVQRGLEPKGRVLTAQDIADWVSDHPAVAMHPYFGRPVDDRLLTFEDWNSLPELRADYLDFEADEMRQAMLQELRQVGSNRALLNRAMIAGHAGVGKTRLALEAIRASGLQHETLYVVSPEGIPRTLLTWVAARPSVRLTLVVDECTFDQVQALDDLAHRCGDRLVLIFVGQERETGGVRAHIPLFWLDKLDDKAIGRIVQKVSSTLPQDLITFVVRSSSGYVKLATAMAESLARNPGLVGAAQLASTPEVRVILESLVPDPKARKAMKALSLLRHVGLDGDVADEGKAVAAFMGLDLRELKEIAEEMRQTGLVVRRGRYRYVTPHLLAVWFAAEVWQARGKDVVNELLRSDTGLPSPAAREALLERLADLGEEDVAGPIVEELLGSGGLFPTVQDLNDPLRSRAFAALAKAAPRVGAAALERVLGRLPRDSLLQFGEGRREIVWLLEGLLTLEETFWMAARLLFRLAEAENETIANSASGTWCEIFLTHLGGTPVPAVDRHRLIAEALDSPTVEARLLGVQAIQTALLTHETRLGGMDVGGHLIPSQWHPQTWGEVWEARRSALGLLDRALADEEARVSTEARDVLIHAARGLIREGLADDILSRLKNLPTSTGAEQRKVWELLQDILSFESEALTEGQRSLIEQWAAELIGDSYPDRLRRWVGPLVMSDYKELKDSDQKPRDMAAVLAEEGFQNPELLRRELEWLASAEPVEFFAFGRRLGQLDSDHAWLADLISLISREGNPGLLTAYLQGRADAGELAWVEDLLDGWSETDPGLASVTLDATWRLTGHDRGAARIVSMIDKGWLPPAQLGWLAYGGWVKSVSANAMVPILQRFVQDSSPEATEGCLLLLMHWLEIHPDEAEAVQEYAWQLLERPCALRSEGMFLFYWKNVAEFYVSTSPGRLARAILSLFDGADFLAIRTDERMALLLTVLVRDPDTVWPLTGQVLLRGDEGSYRLQLSMRDWGAEGLNTQLLIKWAEEHTPRGPRVLAGIAAVGGTSLTPLARELLIRFGHDETIGDTLRAHFLSGTWMGSETQWLRSKLEMARHWLDDDQAVVRAWASELVQGLERYVHQVERREEEEELLWR